MSQFGRRLHNEHVRRVALLAALLPALVLALAAAGPAAPSRPDLEVVSTEPFRVGGTGFRSYERVTVKATLDGETLVLSRRAGRRGRFWVLLPDDACSVTVRAKGNRGSKASLAFNYVTCRPPR
jgi:hypothetical protein